MVKAALAVAALGAGLVAHAGSAVAGPMCRIAELEVQPSDIQDNDPMRAPPQIVAWVEDTAGIYVDTAFITHETGTFGLGNRPGLFDLNSGPKWPYGRRITVFPVWSHKHGIEFPEVVFQNGAENNLSHPFNQSSAEARSCRPTIRTEPAWMLADTGTCASAVFTDKGTLGDRASRYPPRNDVQRTSNDASTTTMFAMLNPFDAVSYATPVPGTRSVTSWQLPDTVPNGDYVMWVEVSREFDHNATYTAAARPAPAGIPFGDYGEPYRGQPSVLYKVPFTIDGQQRLATTASYAGYGDPDGLDGNVRAPDSTITSGIPGSGAGRLQLVVDGTSMFRVRVRSYEEDDVTPPAGLRELAAIDVTSDAATLEFIAPGDDGLDGKVRGYEVRFRIGEEITEENFASSTAMVIDTPAGESGSRVVIDAKHLLYETDYTIAIRPLDNCQNAGPISVVKLRTLERAVGSVDVCFIATAAYGSVMAADVEMLRRFRDTTLQSTVLGELAVTAYYTFGPAVAGVVGESELLRATARAALDPIVATVRILR